MEKMNGKCASVARAVQKVSVQCYALYKHTFGYYPAKNAWLQKTPNNKPSHLLNTTHNPFIFELWLKGSWAIISIWTASAAYWFKAPFTTNQPPHYYYSPLHRSLLPSQTGNFPAWRLLRGEQLIKDKKVTAVLQFIILQKKNKGGGSLLAAAASAGRQSR